MPGSSRHYNHESHFLAWQMRHENAKVTIYDQDSSADHRTFVIQNMKTNDPTSLTEKGNEKKKDIHVITFSSKLSPTNISVYTTNFSWLYFIKLWYPTKDLDWICININIYIYIINKMRSTFQISIFYSDQTIQKILTLLYHIPKFVTFRVLVLLPCTRSNSALGNII